MTVQHVVSKTVEQRLPNRFHPAVLDNVGPVFCIEQRWTMLDEHAILIEFRGFSKKSPVRLILVFNLPSKRKRRGRLSMQACSC